MKTKTNAIGITLLIATIFGSNVANANGNNYYRGKSKSPIIGVTAGFNVSMINAKPEANTEITPLLTYNIGATCRQRLTKTFYSEGQLLFSSKGASVISSFSEIEEEPGIISKIDYTVDYKESLRYIEVPLLAKYQSKSGFNIFAGPAVSFLVSTKTVGFVNATAVTAYNIPGVIEGSETTTLREDISSKSKQDYSKIDFSFALGFGYQLKNGIGFSMNLTEGLRSIYTDDHVNTNGVLAANINYLFN